MRWKNSRNSPFLAENRNTWSVNSTDGGGGLCTRAIHSLLQCGGTSKNSWPRFPFRRTNHHNVFSLFIFRIVQSILGSFSSRYTHVEVSGSRRNMWKKKKKKNMSEIYVKKPRFSVWSDIRIARGIRVSSLLLLLFENVDTFLRGKNVNEEIVLVFVRNIVEFDTLKKLGCD